MKTIFERLEAIVERFNARAKRALDDSTFKGRKSDWEQLDFCMIGRENEVDMEGNEIAGLTRCRISLYFFSTHSAEQESAQWTIQSRLEAEVERMGLRLFLDSESDDVDGHRCQDWVVMI